MAGAPNLRTFVDNELNGKSSFFTWRKTPTQTTGAGIWFDLSMSPGNPVPQYYAASPGAAIALAKSTDGGLEHAGAVTPSNKYLRKVCALTTTATAVPLPMILLDYLLYYPFLDQSITDVQALTNSVTLPRYTDGAGVQMMAVVVAGQTGGQTFQVSYTNQDGTAGRTSGTVTMNSQAVNGTLITSATATSGAAGPFIPLQTGDTGVRSIESITFNGADVGLLTLVLVKPLAQMSIREITAPVEVDYLKDFSALPIIKDNAYLNFICCPNGTLSSAPIHGYIETSWD